MNANYEPAQLLRCCTRRRGAVRTSPTLRARAVGPRRRGRAKKAKMRSVRSTSTGRWPLLLYASELPQHKAPKRADDVAARLLFSTHHNPLSIALEDQRSSSDAPNKSRRGNGGSALEKTRQQLLESPSKARHATRRSSLPSSLPSSLALPGTQQEDPFRANYHAPDNPHQSLSRSRPPAQTVSLYPTSDDEVEEGELHGNLVPNHSLSIAPASHHAPVPPPHQLALTNYPHSSGASPTQTLRSDVDMNAGNAPPTPAFEGFPTASEFKKNPLTAEAENPHKKLPAFEPSSPEESLATLHIQANTGEWDDTVIAYPKLIENLSDKAVAGIEENPDLHLLALPFLSGTYFYKTYTAAAADTRTALTSIAGPGMLIVAAPTAKDPKYGIPNDKYTPQGPMIVRVATSKMRVKLEHYPLVPVTKSLAVQLFNVEKAKAARSWCTALLECNVPGDDIEIGNALRWGTGSALWTTPKLRELIVRGTQPGATLSANARVLEVARTVSVRYVANASSPFWAVYMKPCTMDYKLWEGIRTFLRNTIVEDGIFSFKPLGPLPRSGARPAWVRHVCKCDDHLAYCCPFCAALD
ncbi:hypothetical protein B0H19DRAFT_1056660 [Mycena capillaripes]|nr:hypothetical protein B0H19DRAFT_1056660 [Mycena capillaripes]